MVMLYLWLGFGVFGGMIASIKGRGIIGFFVTLFFLLPGLIVVMLIPTKRKSVVKPVCTRPKTTCPDCAEIIQQDALVCRFCGFRLDGVDRPEDAIENEWRVLR